MVRSANVFLSAPPKGARDFSLIKQELAHSGNFCVDEEKVWVWVAAVLGCAFAAGAFVHVRVKSRRLNRSLCAGTAGAVLRSRRGLASIHLPPSGLNRSSIFLRDAVHAHAKMAEQQAVMIDDVRRSLLAEVFDIRCRGPA